MNTELEDEDNEDVMYEIVYDIDMEERPFGQSFHIYGIGYITGVKKLTFTKDGHSFKEDIFENLEESNPELWKILQEHVDRCVESWGED